MLVKPPKPGKIRRMRVGPAFQLQLVVAIGFCLIAACKPKSSSVPANLETWERTRFEPGGGNAMVCFAIYGSFTNDTAISSATYRTRGLPEGVEVHRFSRTNQPSLPFTGGAIATLLQEKNPAALARIEEAPECLLIQGEVADPPNLNYLRDCVGMATFFMDQGGTVIADVQQIKFMEAAEWRRDFFEPEKPRLIRHVSILYSEDGSGPGIWFHTRGLRKFGRPDLSLRNVPESCREAALDLCNRFIALQADGGRVAEGQEIHIKSLPSGLICHHGGSMEDPDFNNVHVEIQFPVNQ
jgi:hypothetical protein